MGRLRALAGVLVLAAGCYVQPGEMVPRPPVELPQAPPPPLGSLWHPERAANYTGLDVRAHFPGDLLTVVVQETSKGKKNAKTDTKRESSITAAITNFFGITSSMVGFLPADLDGAAIVDANTKDEAKGEGTTSREGTLTASITVTVVDVEANGNLRVRGDKVVTVNQEDQHIVVTGTVRPEDIQADNSVTSTRLADARISYYGYGVVGDKERVPLMHRAFDWVWPF
ncbi:MAG: flagellar basal body L-ring protein FlgH [Candidatus Binatia bacterium]